MRVVLLQELDDPLVSTVQRVQAVSQALTAVQRTMPAHALRSKVGWRLRGAQQVIAVVDTAREACIGQPGVTATAAPFSELRLCAAVARLRWLAPVVAATAAWWLRRVGACLRHPSTDGVASPLAALSHAQQWAKLAQRTAWARLCRGVTASSAASDRQQQQGGEPWDVPAATVRSCAAALVRAWLAHHRALARIEARQRVLATTRASEQVAAAVRGVPEQADARAAATAAVCGPSKKHGQAVRVGMWHSTVCQLLVRLACALDTVWCGGSRGDHALLRCVADAVRLESGDGEVVGHDASSAGSEVAALVKVCGCVAVWVGVQCG